MQLKANHLDEWVTLIFTSPHRFSHLRFRVQLFFSEKTCLTRPYYPLKPSKRTISLPESHFKTHIRPSCFHLRCVIGKKCILEITSLNQQSSFQRRHGQKRIDFPSVIFKFLPTTQKAFPVQILNLRNTLKTSNNKVKNGFLVAQLFLNSLLGKIDFESLFSFDYSPPSWIVYFEGWLISPLFCGV